MLIRLLLLQRRREKHKNQKLKKLLKKKRPRLKKKVSNASQLKNPLKKRNRKRRQQLMILKLATLHPSLTKKIQTILNSTLRNPSTKSRSPKLEPTPLCSWIFPSPKSQQAAFSSNSTMRHQKPQRTSLLFARVIAA